MDKIHRKVLVQCRSKLVSDLSPDNEFWDKIAEKEIFTPLMLEYIQAKHPRPDRVRQLLDDLSRRGPDAYDNFVYCLDNSGHSHLADVIREKEHTIRNPNQQPVLQEARFTGPCQSKYPRTHGAQNLLHSISAQPLSQPDQSSQINSSQSAPNLASSGLIVASPSDEIQDYPMGRELQGSSNSLRETNATGYNQDDTMEDEADHMTVPLVSIVPLLAGSSLTSIPLARAGSSSSSLSQRLGSYTMTTNPKGIVLIINNINFNHDNANRQGAERDQERLIDMFTNFGFQVHVRTDKASQEIEDVLKDFSKYEQLHEVDSLVVVLMSHGNNEIILGTDGQSKNIFDLITLFNSTNCKSMAGKPKMFIVNACRGDGRDTNARIGKTVPFDGRDTENINPRITNQPADCDLLIAYSTYPGYVSYRDEQDGSPFVKCLVEVFTEMALYEHVLDMLTEVNKRMAEGHNQIPNPTNTLLRKWFLFPVS